MLLPVRVTKILGNLINDIRLGGLYGITTKLDERVTSIELGSTDYAALPFIFDGLIGPEDVLVDVGCGRGRIIRWWLSKGYTNRMIGIDFNSDEIKYARTKLKKWENVEFVEGDIFDNLPIDGTLFYLYNPFDRATMQQFKDRLEKEFRHKKEVVLVYYNCNQVDMFKNDTNWDLTEHDIRNVLGKRSSIFHNLAIIRLRAN